MTFTLKVLLQGSAPGGEKSTNQNRNEFAAVKKLILSQLITPRWADLFALETSLGWVDVWKLCGDNFVVT